MEPSEKIARLVYGLFVSDVGAYRPQSFSIPPPHCFGDYSKHAVYPVPANELLYMDTASLRSGRTLRYLHKPGLRATGIETGASLAGNFLWHIVPPTAQSLISRK